MKKIFFNYSDHREDLELYKELNKHFSISILNKTIEIIDKDELFKTTANVDISIVNADMTVPLLSPDYLANQECRRQLDVAFTAKKEIVPVLIRDCLWEEWNQTKDLAKELIPGDKLSVRNHMTKDGDKDTILKLMAKEIKGRAYDEELRTITIKEVRAPAKGINSVLLILSLITGAATTIMSWLVWDNWQIAVLVFLLFATIAIVLAAQIRMSTKMEIS
jgi:hypothetical protein